MEEGLSCDFCGSGEEDFIAIFQGQDCNVCDNCIVTCHGLLSEAEKDTSSQFPN